MPNPQRKHFENWLRRCGAEVLEPTNEYEVVRFRAERSTFVIYQNKAGKVSPMHGRLWEIYQAYLNNTPINLSPRNPRSSLQYLIPDLIHRDGPECFYCGGELAEGEATIEHMVALAHAGLNHPSNLVLAHAECNREAGTLSVAEKVRLRDQMRRHPR